MECDVLIIGSGPAGMSAAMHMKGFGGRVVVLERLSPRMFPRYHSVCGEAVSDRMFSKVGLEPTAVVRRVDRIEIAYPGGVTIDIPVRGSVVDRPAMLSEMKGRCDAEFLHGTATRVSQEGDGFLVETTAGPISCRFLIGADGAHSVVRRDVFGSDPAMLPVVNNLVPGDGGSVLAFSVGEDYAGLYRWRFPSKDGFVSLGSPKGAELPEGTVVTGARHLPFGGVPETVRGNVVLVGDAAGLANALCYGGIGIGMLSGMMAAEAVKRGDLSRYSRWSRKSIYTNPHFMRAHREFSQWTDDDIKEAMRPFRGGYSLARGFVAIVGHPRYANVYFATWMAFKLGW